MNKTTKNSIAKIMFCYAIAYEHYNNENLKNSLLNQLEQIINLYIPVDNFTVDGRDVVVIRESIKNTVYTIREQIKSKLPVFNGHLLKNDLQPTGETVLSFLFFLTEEFLEKTNNFDRLQKWKYFSELCEQDEAYTAVNADPKYMETVEKTYKIMIEVVEKAIEDVK